MTALLAVSLTLVGLAGAAVVLAGTPERQAVTLAFFGLTLTAAFVALEAPDVALSQLGVGTAVVPLMVMLAVRAMRREPGKDTAGGKEAARGREAAGGREGE